MTMTAEEEMKEIRSLVNQRIQLENEIRERSMGIQVLDQAIANIVMPKKPVETAPFKPKRARRKSAAA